GAGRRRECDLRLLRPLGGEVEYQVRPGRRAVRAGARAAVEPCKGVAFHTSLALESERHFEGASAAVVGRGRRRWLGQLQVEGRRLAGETRGSDDPQEPRPFCQGAHAERGAGCAVGTRPLGSWVVASAAKAERLAEASRVVSESGDDIR